MQGSQHLPSNGIHGNKGNGEKIKVGTVTPTLGDRPEFLNNLKNRLTQQTRKADVSIFVDHPPIDRVDIKDRFVKGINECFEQGCDLVLLIEDDDYYPLTYIEEMERAWLRVGKPALMGLRFTTYYHIISNRYVTWKTNHSSAFCSAVAKGCDYNVGDDSPYYDIALWKNNKGIQVDINEYPIGIKHGIGACGGAGHDPNSGLYMNNIDVDLSFLKSIVDDFSFNFYNDLAGANVGVVIVNCETTKLTKRAVDSCLKLARVKVVVVDNSEKKPYTDNRITVLRPPVNLFHGKGLDYGIKTLDTKYIIVLDSDAYIKDIGIVREAKRELENPTTYAVGCFIEAVPKNTGYGMAFDYLQPYFGMFKREVYLRFSPFVHHGAPWCQSMMDIWGKMRVKAIMPEAVHHDGASTIKITDRSWYKNWHIPTNNNFIMSKDMDKFELKKGIVLNFGQGDPRRLTPLTLNDRLAIEYLTKFPNHIKFFNSVPKWFELNSPEVPKKEIDVWMFCFVYNERQYLPHVFDFWTKQGIKMYVIDNYSNDGTWEWLQEKGIPSHRFDTQEMFQLAWLQKELVKTIHRVKPDWIIYGAADLYYAFDNDIKDVIRSAEEEGFNQIRTHCWFTCPTDDKPRKLPLIENYPFCETFSDINMISKYSPNISFLGDHIGLPNPKIKFVEGIIINCGNCKPIDIQEEKLKRRQRAWDSGMHKGWGVHYNTQKAKNWIRDVKELHDIRKSPYAKYYTKILELCKQSTGSLGSKQKQATLI